MLEKVLCMIILRFYSCFLTKIILSFGKEGLGQNKDIYGQVDKQTEKYIDKWFSEFLWDGTTSLKLVVFETNTK